MLYGNQSGRVYEISPNGHIRDADSGEVYGHIPQELLSLYDAAPDLLEAMQGLIGELGRMGLSDVPGDTFADLRNRIDEAQSAIAKATAE
jgi:hypothetical protein